MASDILLALLVIPLMLVVILATASQFSIGTQSQFEGSAVSNELLGNQSAASNTFYPGYNIKDDSSATCSVLNVAGTKLTGTSSPTGTCTVTANTGYDSYVTTDSNATAFSGNLTLIRTYLNYTPYSRVGYKQFTNVQKSTYQGFNLGALLPFLLIAMAIVGVVVGLMATL